MLAKRRNASKPQQDVKLERLKLPVVKIKMLDYERYHHDKDMLKKAATTWIVDPLDLDATTDLESLRKILAKDHNMDTCCFLDCECHYTSSSLKLRFQSHRSAIQIDLQLAPRNDSSGSTELKNNYITWPMWLLRRCTFSRRVRPIKQVGLKERISQGVKKQRNLNLRQGTIYLFICRIQKK